MFLAPHMLRTAGSRFPTGCSGTRTQDSVLGRVRWSLRELDDANEQSGDRSYTGEHRDCRRFAFARSGQGLRSAQTIVTAAVRAARTQTVVAGAAKRRSLGGSAITLGATFVRRATNGRGAGRNRLRRREQWFQLGGHERGRWPRYSQ